MRPADVNPGSTSGTLRVEILSAAHLLPSDLFGSADPYCEVRGTGPRVVVSTS